MFQELGDGIYRRRYESLDLNIGVVVGEDGVLIVDTRASHAQARELVDELGVLTSQPVRWIVNTHYHWDHTFGNAMFDQAEIWGHERCQSALADHGEEMKAGAKAWLPKEWHDLIDEVVITPPQRSFGERASLAIGREVNLTYHGLAHTDSDIVVRVPDADVGFFGDIVEESAPPSFGDAFPDQWAPTLRRAAVDCPSVVVPGHGDVVDEAFVLSQLSEIAEVAAMVEGGTIDRGPYPEEVMRVAYERYKQTAVD